MFDLILDFLFGSGNCIQAIGFGAALLGGAALSGLSGILASRGQRGGSISRFDPIPPEVRAMQARMAGAGIEGRLAGELGERIGTTYQAIPREVLESQLGAIEQQRAHRAGEAMRTGQRFSSANALLRGRIAGEAAQQQSQVLAGILNQERQRMMQASQFQQQMEQGRRQQMLGFLGTAIGVPGQQAVVSGGGTRAGGFASGIGQFAGMAGGMLAARGMSGLLGGSRQSHLLTSKPVG